MELTKKQRKEVYLRAAKKFYKTAPLDNVCYVLAKLVNKDYWVDQGKTVNKDLFPEFYLFSPFKDGRGNWWKDYNPEIWNSQRQTALLLAAEMCND